MMRHHTVPTMLAALLAACSDLSAPVAPAETSSGFVAADVAAAASVRARGPGRRDTPWRRMSDQQLQVRVADAGGRVFIGFKEPDALEGVDDHGRVRVSAATVRAAKAQLAALGVATELEYTLVPAIVARIPSMLVPRLRAHPLVEYVEPIFPGERLTQTTPWNVQRVDAPAAWPVSSGSGQKVLIIDSGIRQGHPDLSPAVWNNCDGSTGVDQFGHGTSVGGVVGALDNSLGIVGVAWGAALWSAKDGDATPDPAYTTCGVQFGRTNGTFAMNLSTSFATPYTPLTDQINGAYNIDGLLVVAAAGNTNGGAVTYPATLDAVIAVSATDAGDAFASFSAAGSKVEIAAPGAGVSTTCLTQDYCTVSGTSFAAPHVAAAAALLKAYNPTWDNREVRRRLGAGARDLGAAGRDPYFGYGLLDIDGAINASTPLAVSISGPTTIKRAGSYTWTASVSGGSGGYAYQWERRTGSGAWYYVGSSSTYSTYESGSQSYTFSLRLTVTAGAQSGSDTHTVNVIIPVF